MDRTEEEKTIANIKFGKFYFFQVVARKKVNQFNFLMGPRSDAIRVGKGKERFEKHCRKKLCSKFDVLA